MIACPPRHGFLRCRQIVFDPSADLELTWSILLSIASEIEAHFHYDLKERALDLWQTLIKHSDYSAEFFQRRDEKLLR